MSSYVPDGLLPKWLLIVTCANIFYSAQNLLSVKLTQRIYSSQPQQVTPLTSRTNSVWTALSGVIRIYAAYNIHNAVLYDLTIWSFGLALLHFGSEWFYFKTASYGPGVLSPIIVAIISLVFSISQRSYYLG